MSKEILSPPGRIVWGNPGKARAKTDSKTGQPVLKDGQPVQQWVFGLAIPKEEFQAHVWPAMAEEIATGFPQGTPPNFSFKYKDGDGVDHKGVPFSNREGHAGCMILTVATESFAPPIFKLNPQSGQYDQWPAEQIKTGDYVRVSLSMKVNVPTNPTHTPGIYVNPQGVEFLGYGEEIHNGPDAQGMFGGQAAALPQGASATPLASTQAPGMPIPQPAAAPLAPVQPAAAPLAPVQPAAAPLAPVPGQVAMPAPAQNFVPQQPAPLAPVAPVAAPLAPVAPVAAPLAPVAPVAAPIPGAMPPR